MQGEAQTFGVDWNGPLPAEDNERDTVEVPDTDCPLCDADQAELQRTISPLFWSQ